MMRVIAFDVNETLLDLRSLDPHFEELLGSAALRGQWFAQMLQLSFVGGLTGEYVDFATAQQAALHMIAKRHEKAISDHEARTMVERVSSLPAYSDVTGALAELHQQAVRMVALTNSTAVVAEAQLRNAGIRQHFDAVISADSVRALKPAPAPYHAVAEQLGVACGEVRLVAAHAWDISGALAARLNAAFVARPGMVLSPIGPQPDIISRNIAAVVEQIVERDLA